MCVRSSDGTIQLERRCRTAGVPELLAKRAPAKVLIESGAEAFQIAELAKAAGHQVCVVPSTLVRALGVGARGVKNDVRDARQLSEASCRMELPSVHVPSPLAREWRSWSSSHDVLVAARTKLINHVRGHLRTRLLQQPARSASFTKRTRERMLATPDGNPQHIEDVLATVDHLRATIDAAKKRIADATSGHPVCELLMTVPGVGPITALRYVALVDQVDRFPTAHHLESYLGLTSGERTTGFSPRPTGLTKAGSSAMRRLMIQAAWCAMRTRRGDPMVQWALRIAERRNKKIAVAALARKMAGVLYAIWRDGTAYDPSRAAATNT